MHELSLCDAIARAVVAHAGDRRVRSVQLRVGALRQVVPDTLVYCWSMVCGGSLTNGSVLEGSVPEGSVLEGSVLEIDLVPGVIECRGCATRTELNRFVLRCPECGGDAVSVVSGEELLVVSIDVVGDLDPCDAPETTETVPKTRSDSR